MQRKAIVDGHSSFLTFKKKQKKMVNLIEINLIIFFKEK